VNPDICKAFGSAAGGISHAHLPAASPLSGSHVNKALRTWYSGNPAGCSTIKMTAVAFRALRFAKSADMVDRCGAARLADFTIPFWIDATDGGTQFAQKFPFVTAVALETSPRMDTNGREG